MQQQWLIELMKEPPDELTWQRFMNKVQIQDNGCWMWTGAKAPGRVLIYGAMTIKRRTRLVHRLMCIWVYGEQSIKHLQVDHLVCNQPLCVNPIHLLPCTAKFNNTRKGCKGNGAKNAAKTHCKNGHPLSGDNLYPSALKLGMRTCRKCYMQWRRDDAKVNGW